MSKSGKNNLGRTLIKDRFGNRNRPTKNKTFLHTSELKDGYDWNRINLQSVTEQDSFQEFLSTAELAGTEFVAEKLNITFVKPQNGAGLLSKEVTDKTLVLHRDNKNLLKIPRRPHWDYENTSADKLQEAEREMFLEWRRTLTLFQEESGLLITPYEKNLDLWRQLWRVVERSDVIVQIVDARNPLLFRCEDLELYAKEVDERKENVILCNKSDFLTKKQRSKWARYFDTVGITVIFFSAISTNDVINEEHELENKEEESNEDDNEEEDSDDDNNYETEDEEVITGLEIKEEVHISRNPKNSSKLLTREELIDFFRSFSKSQVLQKKDCVTVGLVGYPNVGKSSTINSLLTYKKVSVSSTPGKTKHFQTLYLDNDILLCDCPGLVMPSFVLTKADMILNGILPIDQLRDHVPPVNLLCTFIPRHILEDKYGIMIPKPDEEEDPHRPPFSEELLNAYAFNRGFMTANGQPDNARAARYVLKDFVNGKLLYCYAPPACKQEDFHIYEKPSKKISSTMTPAAHRAIKPFKPLRENLGTTLLQPKYSDIHRAGPVRNNCNGLIGTNGNEAKAWKNHKYKRNTHQKSRIKYHYLDV